MSEKGCKFSHTKLDKKPTLMETYLGKTEKKTPGKNEDEVNQ